MKFLVPLNFLFLGTGCYMLTRRSTMQSLKGVVMVGKKSKSLPVMLSIGVFSISTVYLGLNCAALGVSVNPMNMVRRHREELVEIRNEDPTDLI